MVPGSLREASLVVLVAFAAFSAAAIVQNGSRGSLRKMPAQSVPKAAGKVPIASDVDTVEAKADMSSVPPVEKTITGEAEPGMRITERTSAGSSQFPASPLAGEVSQERKITGAPALPSPKTPATIGVLDPQTPTAVRPVDTGPASLVLTNASVEDAREAMRKGDYEGAATILSSQQLAGDGDAIYQLSNLYRQGRGVRADSAQAFKLMHKAAELGNVEAEFSLGRMYLSGEGTETDRDKAQEWIARAAESGHVGATEALVALMTGRLGSRPQAEASSEPQQPTRNAPVQLANGETELHLAARKGDPEAIARLVAEGANPNARDASGRTPLMVAASQGAEAAVVALLDAGANLTAKDTSGQTALSMAFAAGACPTADSLIEHGAARQLHVAIPTALRACGGATLKLLAKSGTDLASKDDLGRNAVWYAAREGKAGAISYLLGRGLDPDSADANKTTALMAAVNAAQSRAALELVKGGADPNAATQTGNTALHLAAVRGLDDVAAALIKAGADLNGRNRDGYSALMLAAKYGREDVFRTLLNAGADTSLRNAKRERAADIARLSGHEDLAALVE